MVLSPPDYKSTFFAHAPFADNAGKIFHAFFGRRGGVSEGVYASLNCGPGSNDKPENVIANRKIVADAMGAEERNILSLYQEHGSTCITVTKTWAIEQRPKADAMVTDVPGIVMSVLAADCAPVLFYGFKADGSPVVGAAHAGWKGAIGGILDSTVLGMLRLGAESKSIKACVGPCIHKTSYEVSESFLEPFMAEDENNEKFFLSGKKPGHFQFDLAGYCAVRLYKAGVMDVHLMDMDTYSNEADFFSYRRTTHRKEPDYGRQISAIVIK